MTVLPTSSEPFSWGASRSGERVRLRDILPPIAAALLLALANLAFGAVQPTAALPLSAALILVGMTALFIAGPKSAPMGVAIAALVLLGLTASGLAGPLYRAGSHVAVLFAAGAMFLIGHIAVQRRATLNAMWATLIWASLVWCGWMFATYVSTTRGTAAPVLADAFETPANGALVFGLLAIVALGKLLQIVKSADADSSSMAQLFEQLLREGVGAMLLLIVAVTCTVLLGSMTGTILLAAVLIGQAWWDTLGITRRAHYGIWVRIAVVLVPLVALGLAGWGAASGWIRDETIAPGLGVSEVLPNLQRMEAYGAAWMESPFVGHGFGSIPAESAQYQTLDNAKAMLDPGGPQNVFLAWSVELGLLGIALLMVVALATHRQILMAMTARKASRTFPRMALAASALLLLHGLTDSSLNVPAATWLYALLVGAACGLAPSKKA